MGYKIVVEGGNLHFDSAHFITYAGKCERLHGHNYGVSVTIEGELTADSYVFDFVTLKKLVRQISETLDHRFLVPTANPHLVVQQGPDEWEICFEQRRYVFPARDMMPLPLDNITAERLAEYFWRQLAAELPNHKVAAEVVLTVGIEEAPGQAAYFSQALAIR